MQCVEPSSPCEVRAINRNHNNDTVIFLVHTVYGKAVNDCTHLCHMLLLQQISVRYVEGTSSLTLIITTARTIPGRFLAV